MSFMLFVFAEANMPVCCILRLMRSPSVFGLILVELAQQLIGLIQHRPKHQSLQYKYPQIQRDHMICLPDILR
jgi:hypothetical protein